MLQRASNKLYYDLIQTGVPYFTEKSEFSLSQSDEFFRLPDNFYKPLVVLYKPTADEYYIVPNGELRDASDGYKTASGYGYGYGYRTHSTKKHIILDRQAGSELFIIPDDDKAGDYLMEYAPDSPEVVNLRAPKGWVDYLLYGATLELGIADYNTRQEWAEIMQDLKNKIMSWAINRSPFETGRIQRVQQEDDTIEDIDNRDYSESFYSTGS